MKSSRKFNKSSYWRLSGLFLSDVEVQYDNVDKIDFERTIRVRLLFSKFSTVINSLQFTYKITPEIRYCFDDNGDFCAHPVSYIYISGTERKKYLLK